MKLILASKSPRRKQILEDNGYDITVDISHANEDSVKADTIQNKVMQIAKLKANTVAKKHINGIIVAVDTLVYFEGKEIGQQKNPKDAMATLKKLIGKTHKVYSGVCIMVLKKGIITNIIQDFEVTNVKLKKINDNLLKEYVDAGHYQGKAGAYNIDDPEFKTFIDKIDGSYTNVMGLPIEKFKKVIKLVKV